MSRSRRFRVRLSVNDLECRTAPAALTAGNLGIIKSQTKTVTPAAPNPPPPGPVVPPIPVPPAPVLPPAPPTPSSTPTPSPSAVANWWNAQLAATTVNPDGTYHYAFVSTPGLFNAVIAPNASTAFGFNTSMPQGTPTYLTGVTLNGMTPDPGGNVGGSKTGTVSQSIRSDWGSGSTNDIIIRNTGTPAMLGWTVEFDAAFTVTDVWNATLVSHSGTHYVFQNLPGAPNANLAVNGTAAFGFNDTYNPGDSRAMQNILLNGIPVGGGGNNGGGNNGGSTTGTVTQSIRSTWGTGATNDITVKNTGTGVMKGWTVEFDAPFTTAEVWNAQLASSTPNSNGTFHYVFTNIPGFWNTNIPANGSVTFGFNSAFPAGTNPAITNIKLNGTSLGGNNGGNNNGGGNTGGSTTGFVLQALRNQLPASDTNDVTVKNTGTTTMQGWKVEFDAPFTVTDSWNATLVSSAPNGNGTFHYVFTNTPGLFNSNILPNGTALFGFNTTFAVGTNPTMLNTKLNGVVVGNNGAGGTTDLGGGNQGGSTTGTVLQALRNQLPASATDDVTIKNTGNTAMNGWKVEFDAPFTVTDVWNATLVSSAPNGNGTFHYVFQSIPGSFNATIPANGTALFGFNTTFAVGTNPTMLNTKLNGTLVGNNGAGGTTDLGTGGGNNNGGGGTNQNFTANVTETAQDFGPGSTNNLTIHNTGPTAINGWTLAFDAPFTITQVWNATLVSSTANPGGGFHYVFNNIPSNFNANILPNGGTATFGFNTQYAPGTTTAAVTNTTLNGKAV